MQNAFISVPPWTENDFTKKKEEKKKNKIEEQKKKQKKEEAWFKQFPIVLIVVLTGFVFVSFIIKNFFDWSL